MSETVMDILGEYNLPYYAANHGLTKLAEALAAARREVETVTQRAIRAEADLATSRAEREDVRRVEKWLAKDFQLGRYVKTTGSGKLVAIEEDPDMAVVAISLEALGRALAQEAGDG